MGKNQREQLEEQSRDLTRFEMDIASIHQRLNEIEQGLPGKPELILVELEEVGSDE